MAQTSVEWLDLEIDCISIQLIDGCITFNEFMEKKEELFIIAKEMHKQEIIDFHIETMKIGLISEGYKKWKKDYMPMIKSKAEEYYNETFNK